MVEFHLAVKCKHFAMSCLQTIRNEFHFGLKHRFEFSIGKFEGLDLQNILISPRSEIHVERAATSTKESLK